ncbi:hypothetical protein N431DRAFT_547237 [Stipitochalara longipes BDJ]|nr:hypothetical protein N431DRAFT_547237 [Stipitochalara longipes BDJ]
MSSTTLYLRARNGELELVTPRGPVNPENNIFDNAFNAGVEMEECVDWMKWEASELGFLEDRREGLVSNISLPGSWSTDYETGDKDAISCSYSTSNAFPFEDALFELNGTPPQSSILSLSLGGALYPAELQPQQDLRRSFHGFSSLTEAEERDLQDIAMPSRILSAIQLASEPSSPIASDSYHSPSPEPETKTRTRKTNKRKSLLNNKEVPSALCQSRKSGHNAIEKRYRTNLNDKINCLRLGIPELSTLSSSDSKSDEECEDSDGEELNSKTTQQKYGKADVLSRALEYIKHLETATQRLGGEVDVLITRVGAFERLAMGGSIMLNGKSLGEQNVPSLVKSEKLKSIQENFKQIMPEFKAVSAAAPRRRGSKQAKMC